MTREAQKKAYVVRDNDSGAVVIFEKSGAAARRWGANELDIEFESVESCRRESGFDSYAEQGFVPAEVLIESGWHFECQGCYKRVDSDLEGYHRFRGRERVIRLKPIYEARHVWCCPSCKTRHEKDQRIRREMEAAAIEDFKARVLRRFPVVTFPEKPEGAYGGPHHASARRENGIYGLRQVAVSFEFPGQKIAPATYRWDDGDDFGSSTLIGPHAPRFWCCAGDKEAFEAFAKAVK